LRAQHGNFVNGPISFLIAATAANTAGWDPRATGPDFALSGIRYNFMEFEILRLMKQSPGTLFSDREIGKIMDRKAYRESPHWARPLLEKMVFEKLIWKEAVHFLYPTDEQQEERRRKGAKGRAHSADSAQPA
jgi:hypothetical protein